MKDTIFSDFIERLRANASLVSIVSDYIPLTKKGQNYWGCCPFHQENTPSFSVSEDKGFFHCFGCKIGGNIFSFLMKIENIEFFEAVKLLADKLNIPLPEAEKSPRDKMLEEEKEKIFKVCELAGEFFHVCLLKTNYGKPAREYLEKRGVPLESIEQFKLGFAPPAWDKLTAALLDRKISLDILLKAGLAVPNKSGNGVYDRFRNRIMFPISNAKGRIIGFGGRIIDNTEPKYLNSPETRLFNKRHALYGFNIAYKHIRQLGQAVIVEGYLDVITAHSFGFKNTVASLGTAFTQEQARLLLKCNNPEFIFAYDSDTAGKKASDRALVSLKTIAGVKIKVADISEAKDPDEYLRKRGKDDFKSLLDNSRELLDYQISRVLEETDYSLIEEKAKIAAKIAPILNSSNNAIEVNAYISQLAQKIGIDEDSLRIELGKHSIKFKKDKNVKTGKDKITLLSAARLSSANTKAERQLIRLMFENNWLIPYCKESLSTVELASGERREIINFIFNAYNSEAQVNISSTILSESQNRLSDNALSEFSQIMLNEDYGSNSKVAAGSFEKLSDIKEVYENFVNDYIRSIKLAHLNSLYERHRLIADELERMGDKNFLQELAESQRIKNEISKLHQH